MKYYLLGLVLLMISADILAQCAPTGRGTGLGRRFLLIYDNQADRDAALAQISTITVGGVTYSVEAHPSNVNLIRTTPAQPDGTFANPFTGVVMLNLTAGGSMPCHYILNVFPIELAHFKGQMTHQGVKLDWATYSELNNDRFELERSYDTREVEFVSMLKGAGSSNEMNHYSYTDVLETEEEQVYYRLKQVDINGDTYFTDWISIDLESKTRKTDVAQVIDLASIAKYIQNQNPLAILDFQGRQLSSRALNPGLYILLLNNNTSQRVLVVE